MSTIDGSTMPPRTDVAGQRGSGFLERCRAVLREWQQRERLKTRLNGLSDAELTDIGISRGEIDHVAMNRGTEPRGACAIDRCDVIRGL